jgi:hypothetical protein
VSEYTPYKIKVENAEPWMDRPLKLSFTTETPNGSNSQVVYIDEAERDEMVRLLAGLSENGSSDS